MTVPDSLPTDADALRALLLAERARHGEERERWMACLLYTSDAADEL